MIQNNMRGKYLLITFIFLNQKTQKKIKFLI